MNDLKDGEKLILSFLIAVSTSFAIALIANIWIQNPFIMLIIAVAISAYVLIAGFHKNGDLENSIGGLFGQMTDWVMPAGISWWFPSPIGEVLHKTNVGKMEIDHTRANQNQVTHVETLDGAQVEVSYYCLFKIVNLRTWSSVEDPKKALDAMMDRCVRWFVSYWNVDGENSITTVKEPFSHYLMGHKVPGPTKSDGSAGPELEALNFIDEILRDLGVEIISARVDDVNPPKSIVEANEAKTREVAEADREKRDIDSLGARSKELQEKLGITAEEALRAAQAARGDIEVIDVRGGGDFSKGAAIERSNRKKRGDGK